MASPSALSQIIQSEAELPLQLNCTAHRNFCGLVCHSHFCLALLALHVMFLHSVLVVSILCHLLMSCHIQLNSNPQLKFTFLIGHPCARVLFHTTDQISQSRIQLCEKITLIKIAIKKETLWKKYYMHIFLQNTLVRVYWHLCNFQQK